MSRKFCPEQLKNADSSERTVKRRKPAKKREKRKKVKKIKKILNKGEKTVDKGYISVVL